MSEKIIAFYDRSLRLWTAYSVDADGNQCSKTGYGTSKALAIADAAS